MAADFVHLHVHSEFSILDGACRIPALAVRAAELEMPAVGLTDHGSLAGAVQLFKHAGEQGVKPIIGCEVYVCDDAAKQEKGYAHLTLLAESNEGYGNLIKLASAGYLQGYYYKPRVDWSLLESHSKGLIALSGCLSGRVSKALEESREGDAAAELDRLVQVFGRDSTYVEIQNAGLEQQARINPLLARMAEGTGLPLVATGDVHYLLHEDARAHEALLCIQSGDSLKNPNHWKFDTDQFFFKTPEEMAVDFAEYPAALARTLEVAERCNVEIELGTIRLPRYPVPEDRDAFDYLVELCEKGLAKRYDRNTPELQERLKYELKTIREMGFADYFLIVWDFVNFAKRSGISVGPGRGSTAGSLAAYCLEITDVDPIRYDLLFERFLNPGRKSMPDMDIDFSVAGRDRVINYVAEKYGRDRVAQIITFGTMMARAAVRDAGRVLEIPYGNVDKIAKLIPEGPKVYLDECLKPGAELRAAYDSDPEAKEIIDLAKPLEGLIRQDSIHAAGVVISDRPLTDVVPLQRKGEGQETVTQFGMWDVEALGLLKMDFLGLRNLDVIDKAVGLIGGGLDIAKIPMDDAKTFEMLARGDSIGVFQFESSGMRDALKQVRPTGFEDLIALVALYRPGPMGYIPVYAKRKNGREPVTFIDPRLEAITGVTHGTCLTGDTLVFDAASGRRVRMDQLGESDDFLVQGVDEDLSLTHARITAWVDNGVKPVYRLRLRNGTTIKATADHRFLTEGGWRELRDLDAGDFLGTPSALRLAREGRYLDARERARIRVLAYLLADGSLSCASPPCFYSSNKALLEDFERACGQGFADVRVSRFSQARGVTRIYAARDAVLGHQTPSPLEAWLREHGLRWKLSDERAAGTTRKGPRSAEKWLPEIIFELAEEEIARFLAAYWDCDGHVDEKCAWIKTTSSAIAHDLQTLLLRLGVRSTIHESGYQATDRGRPVQRRAYQVTARGTQRFAELIQPFMITQKRWITTTAQDSSRTLDRASSLQEVLDEATRLIPVGNQQQRDGRLSISALASQTGINHQHFYPAQQARQRIALECVEPATAVLELPMTTRASRVVWQEIDSIEPAGSERVYDITVEGIHNFVASNLLVHNCIYQEQYLEIAKQIAGFSPAEADDLRKAIGKKLHDLMASLKEKFLEGCAQTNTPPAVANQLWKDMESSQDYSFGKAHSACYAMIAYRTAWLRANHPREYMAALISSVMNTKDRVPFYVSACHELGIEVEPPDVNESECDFAVVEGKIRFGLNAVKNVGDSAARAIVAARGDGGAFTSIWNFTERVDPQVANKRALEALVRCGALDSTGDSRGGMIAVLDSATSWGGRMQADRLAGQGSIFDLGGEEETMRPEQHPSVPVIELDKNELLRMEKETLGVYVSEHPLQAIREQLRRKTDCGLAEAEKRRDGEVVTVGGIVGAIKQLTTKKGEPMVFMRLDDLAGSIEVVVFNSVYGAARDLIELDSVLVVKGRIDHKQEGETKLLAMEVSAFESIAERREVRLKVDGRKAPAGIVRSLAGVVKEFPGEMPVIVAITTSQGETTLALGPDYRVKPEPDFFAEVKSLLGEAAVA